MKKTKVVTIAGREVECVLRQSSRSRQIKISIYQDGRLGLSRPRFVSESRAEKFLLSKLDWIAEKLTQVRNLPIMPHDQASYKKHKEKARDLILQKIGLFNRQYNFPYNRISIRNQKTRWGSCSRAGNLNFNYKIVFLPEELVDYIVVHELCHLRELNHSPRFWRLVAQSLPNFLELREKLRKRGFTLV